MEEISNQLIKEMFKPGTIFFWIELLGIIAIMVSIIYAIFKKKDNF